MDAIRKKMQSLKTETDTMTAQADQAERVAAEANKKADKHDCDIRDLQKKIGNLESKYDDVSEKVHDKLYDDMPKTVRPWLEDLLNNDYKAC